jgi:hypothetical protein
LVLARLLEALTGRKCTSKQYQAPKMRIQKVENLNGALRLLHDCGVKPPVIISPESLLDASESCLHLSWKLLSSSSHCHPTERFALSAALRADEKSLMALAWSIITRFLPSMDADDEYKDRPDEQRRLMSMFLHQWCKKQVPTTASLSVAALITAC